MYSLFNMSDFDEYLIDETDQNEIDKNYGFWWKLELREDAPDFAKMMYAGFVDEHMRYGKRMREIFLRERAEREARSNNSQ